MLEARLRDVPFLSSLTDKELALVAQQTDRREVPAGEILAREGDTGDELLIVESGTAEVTRDGERIAELGPGDAVGEGALVADERRTATVTAISPMELVVMSRDHLRAVERMLPEVHAQIVKAIEDSRARRD